MKLRSSASLKLIGPGTFWENLSIVDSSSKLFSPSATARGIDLYI